MMNYILAGLLVLVLVIGWLLLRRRQNDDPTAAKPATSGTPPKTAYHAVSIRFASNACKAAREMEGRRFLSSAAPRLPLPDCDVLECSCRFVHHKDRRTGQDRRSELPTGFGAATGTYKIEQRQGRDRRKDDDDDLF